VVAAAAQERGNAKKLRKILDGAVPRLGGTQR